MLLEDDSCRSHYCTLSQCAQLGISQCISCNNNQLNYTGLVNYWVRHFPFFSRQHLRTLGNLDVADVQTQTASELFLRISPLRFFTIPVYSRVRRPLQSSGGRRCRLPSRKNSIATTSSVHCEPLPPQSARASASLAPPGGRFAPPAAAAWGNQELQYILVATSLKTKKNRQTSCAASVRQTPADPFRTRRGGCRQCRIWVSWGAGQR
jgi:hypothetical protein